MPTYEYECSACDHAFEALQTMTEPKLTKCPKCGKDKLARLIGSGSGLIFKGTGFYETDYKKKDVPAAERKPATESKPAIESKQASSCASCPMKESGGCS